ERFGAKPVEPVEKHARIGRISQSGFARNRRWRVQLVQSVQPLMGTHGAEHPGGRPPYLGELRCYTVRPVNTIQIWSYTRDFGDDIIDGGYWQAAAQQR